MLLVKTYLAPSKIHGVGVFASESIPKGTVTWLFDPAFDMEVSQERVSMEPEAFRNFLDTHAYVNAEGKYVLCCDNNRYVNHSDDANQKCDETATSYFATKDIEVGEEMTVNYVLFDEIVARQTVAARIKGNPND